MTATKNAKPDPKPAAKTRKPRLTAAQKAAATEQVATELANVDVDAAIASATEPVVDSSPADENAPDPRQVMPNTSLAKLKDAAKASSERRAKNAADKAKVKALNADERGARRSAIDAFHQTVIDAFKGGKTIKEIAAANTNAKTGKVYSPSTILWILKKHGIVEQGPGRVKFDLDRLDGERRIEVECAFTTLQAAAEENGITIAALVKAFTKA